MKVNERLNFQKFVDQIEFPTVVFVYESRRIIAINSKGKALLSPENTVLKFIPDEHIRQHVTRQILDREIDILFDMPVMVNNQEIRIDLEIISFEVDKKHVVISTFDYSDNQSFGDAYANMTPRFFWKDKKLNLKGANYFCRKDFSGSNILFEDVTMAYDDEVAEILRDGDLQILTTKEPLWDVVQFIRYNNNSSKFVKINRIPIMNKNGTVIGIFGCYHHLHNRDEVKRLFEWLKEENSRLTKLLSINDTLFFRIRIDDKWSVDYVTPNISRFGYTPKDFYLGQVTLKSFIAPEDLHRNIRQFYEAKKSKNQVIELQYRVQCADGTRVWVKGQTINVDRYKESTYVDFVLTDISNIKTLQEELQVSKDALKLKINTIVKGKLPVRRVHITDLFQIENLIQNCKSFSELLNISCVITDYSGIPLNSIMKVPGISDEVYQFYTSKEANKIFKDLCMKAKKQENVMYEDWERNVYVHAIPFIIEGKCIGLWNVLSNEMLTESSKILSFLKVNILQMCASVQKNMELIRERDKTDKLQQKLSHEISKSTLLECFLEVATVESELDRALDTVIKRLSVNCNIGEVLMFVATVEEPIYVKQLEWNKKGDRKESSPLIRESIDITRHPDLSKILEMTNIIIYQPGEIPRYIQQELGERKYKSLVMLHIEMVNCQKVLFLFGYKEDRKWKEDTLHLLSDTANVIKLILDSKQ